LNEMRKLMSAIVKDGIARDHDEKQATSRMYIRHAHVMFRWLGLLYSAKPMQQSRV